MTEAVQISIVVSLPAYLMAGVAAYGAWLGRKNGQKIDGVHTVINSRMDELLKARGAEGVAAGIQQEREESRQRVADKAADTKAEKLADSHAGSMRITESPK